MYYGQTRIGAESNEMILIPAGEFIRGTDQRLSDEGPQHKVSLGDFYIDKYEVTNLQYQQFIDATQGSVSAARGRMPEVAATHRKSPDHFENRTFPEGKADHPVTFVSWHDAKAYCDAVGKRLPTDQEWEKAACGTDGRTYPWGEVFDVKKVNSPVRWGSLKCFMKMVTIPLLAMSALLAASGVLATEGTRASEHIVNADMSQIDAGEFIMGSNKVDRSKKAGEFGATKPWYQDEHPEP